MFYQFDVSPKASPRMTRSDKWKVRSIVASYRYFKDKLREEARKAGFTLPDHGMHIIFYMPMPKSWSKKMKAEMEGAPHKLLKKNDVDNLIKSVFDTLCPEGDGHIYDVRISKYWAAKGHIEIITMEQPNKTLYIMNKSL